MRTLKFVGLVLLGLIVQASFVTGSAKADEFLDDTAEAIFKKVNDYRSANGLNALEDHETLIDVSETFAKYMADNNNMSHTADGRTPSQRMKEAGYNWCATAENIAMSSPRGSAENLADFFMNQWKNSPGHNANMLSKDVVDIGVGVAKDASGNYYAVQKFGRSGC